MMEESLKQYKFPFRRVQELGLLRCFMVPRHKRHLCAETVELLATDNSSEKEAKKSTPAKCARSHAGDDHLLDHKLTALSDDRHMSSPSTRNAEACTEVSFVFSPPALADDVLESPSFRTISDPLLSSFSYDDCAGPKSGNLGAKTFDVNITRSTSFGGRPQPLPVPVSGSQIFEIKPAFLPLPAPQDTAAQCANAATSSSELSQTTSASTSASMPSSTSASDGDGIGSWSVRRVGSRRVAPTGGLPLPLPSDVASKLLPYIESYEFHELSRATQEFAPECCMEKGEFGAVYRAWVKDKSTEEGSKKEMAVLRLSANDSQTLKEWRADVQMLAQLLDTSICLIKGYCAHEVDLEVKEVKTLKERLLVFEQSPNGNLHDYLCGSRSKTQLDWTTRISIVLGAARGLLYLHDRAPLQVVCSEFKASCVLLDKNYAPRLAGYGLTVTSPPPDRKSPFSTVMKTSQAHAKTNVWSFGIVLLELLTGKYSRDPVFLCDEKNFVQWATPFLKEESKVVLILDPRMKAKCPSKGALKLAELALQCLRKKEVQRPSMSKIVEALKAIKQDFGGRVEQHTRSTALERRRATFGGLSFRDLEFR